MKTFLKIIAATIILLLGVTYFGNNDESKSVNEINNKIESINNSVEGDSLYYVLLKEKLQGFYQVRSKQLWLETRKVGTEILLIPVIDDVPKSSIRMTIRDCKYKIDKNLLTINGWFKEDEYFTIMIKKITDKTVYFQIKSKDLNKTLEGEIVNSF